MFTFSHQSFRKLSNHQQLKIGIYGNSIVSRIRIIPLSKHRFLPHKQLFVWKYLYDKILTFGNWAFRAYDWVFELTIGKQNLPIIKHVRSKIQCHYYRWMLYSTCRKRNNFITEDYSELWDFGYRKFCSVVRFWSTNKNMSKLSFSWECHLFVI